MHQDVYIISTGRICSTILRGLGGTPSGIARRWCRTIPHMKSSVIDTKVKPRPVCSEAFRVTT